MIPVLLIVVAGAALAALTYVRLERLGARGLLPALVRAVAWIALGLLVVNPGCPAVGVVPAPLVLLDNSLSMGAAGGRWDEARGFAQATGDVRVFGGEPAQDRDSLPTAGQSLLGPALSAAVATGRPIVLVSDGEITDRAGVSSSLLQAAAVRLFPRRDQVAAGLARVTGPARIREGDSLVLRVEVVTRGLGLRDLPVNVLVDGREIHRGRLLVSGDGRTAAEIVIAGGQLPAGEQLLSIGLADSVDAERRDDRRLYLVAVSPTPGIVLAAAVPDWDARFLYRTLAEVTALPVEGYVQLQPGAWRRMADLVRVNEAEVRGAIRGADLAVLRGQAPGIGSRQGTVLFWPTAGGAGAEGDWYLAAGPGGPVQGALAGAPVDSFPPASALVPLSAGAEDWIGLTVQAGRRGSVRPALIGSQGGGARRITIGAQGLWRWAFRGGSSEQAYRALVASMVDWLLAAPDTARGSARPLHAVVPRGTALVFQSVASPPEPIAVRFEGTADQVVTDTLRFDGAGRAEVSLPPGVYVYTLGNGGRGRVAVEDWSEEWFPRPVVLADAEPGLAPTPRSTGLRSRLWLFGIAILALSAEWFLRRRMGLR